MIENDDTFNSFLGQIHIPSLNTVALNHTVSEIDFDFFISGLTCEDKLGMAYKINEVSSCVYEIFTESIV